MCGTGLNHTTLRLLFLILKKNIEGKCLKKFFMYQRQDEQGFVDKQSTRTITWKTFFLMLAPRRCIFSVLGSLYLYVVHYCNISFWFFATWNLLQLIQCERRSILGNLVLQAYFYGAPAIDGDTKLSEMVHPSIAANLPYRDHVISVITMLFPKIEVAWIIRDLIPPFLSRHSETKKCFGMIGIRTLDLEL